MIPAGVEAEWIQRRGLLSWTLMCTCVQRAHSQVSEFSATDATVVERASMIKEREGEVWSVLG